jgi:hypothetical protein
MEAFAARPAPWRRADMARDVLLNLACAPWVSADNRLPLVLAEKLVILARPQQNRSALFLADA